MLQINDISTQTEACVGCTHLAKENRRLSSYWLNAKSKLEAERKETARLHAIIENVAQHRIEDELDEFEAEIEKDSEDIDIDEIMNESGSVDIAEDDDYVVEDDDFIEEGDDDFIEEGENEDGLNETINS